MKGLRISLPNTTRMGLPRIPESGGKSWSTSLEGALLIPPRLSLPRRSGLPYSLVFPFVLPPTPTPAPLPELLAEFANYFHYGYHECMKNLVHYLTTVERMETKDTKYARILAFLQSKARLGAETAFQPLAPLPEPDFSHQLHAAGPELGGHCPGDASVFPQGAAAGPFPWQHGAARSPAMPYLPSAPVPLPSPAQQHSPFLAPVQGLDRHYLNLIGHAHPGALNLHAPQHPPVL